jgi:hypothetical protein
MHIGISISSYKYHHTSNRFEYNDLIRTGALIPLEGFKRGFFKKNPLSGIIPMNGS